MSAAEFQRMAYSANLLAQFTEKPELDAALQVLLELQRRNLRDLYVLNNVVAIAAGRSFNLALKADGTVVGWGLNNYGETTSPKGLNNAVAIAARSWYSLALKANGTVVGWGDNSTGPIEIPSDLTNVVAMAGSLNRSLFLTTAPESGSLSFLRGQIPTRVLPMLIGNIQNTVHELSFTGSVLDDAAVQLSGAKALIQAVLEFGMPYTLERDEILHGFLYGTESLTDVATSRAFLDSEIEKLQSSRDAVPLTLSEVSLLRYLRFTERLNLSLTHLETDAQPEIPRIVSHTLRLLNLLRDSWDSSPPPSLEIACLVGNHQLFLYGEPYMRYSLQYRDSLNTPDWITTTFTHLHNEDFITLPMPGSKSFYRVVLP